MNFAHFSKLVTSAERGLLEIHSNGKVYLSFLSRRYLHDQGVMHCDLKSPNVLLTPEHNKDGHKLS